jgi:Domain of unknown function (DUF4375)
MVAMRIALKSYDAQAQSWLLWNSFLEVIARNPNELEDFQIPAHLVFMFESEVQNGGHLQYLENQGTEGVPVTVEALGMLGASCQAQILKEVVARYLAKERVLPETAEQYSELALEGEFDGFDARFHACKPSLGECLERHLNDNTSLYLDIE